MILVTGATGNVGREVVGRLHAAGCVFRALTRHPERARLPDDVEVVAGDLDDPPSLRSALRGTTAIFLMGRTRLAEQTASLVETMDDPDKKRIVLLSSASVEVDTPEAIARWRLGTLRHRSAEDAVRRSGAAWTFLRPGAFTSNTAFKWAESIRTEGVVEVMFADETEALIDPIDIAEVAVHALCEPGHAGQAYTLTGPEGLTPVEQVGIIGDVIGRDIAIESPPPAAQRERLRGMVRSADLDLAMRPGRMPWAVPLPTVKHLLGRHPHTFRQWVVRNKRLFGAAQ